ncbi:PVC-type heme-binding CxxCH protein [Jiulongibacter sediminis]|uniref:Cytochrome c domain-containing protein n=1 Tax=Jiulongibacter sediminis TaxID=1605367 RepID=A0A0P7BZY7_9BACT|nr:PVC-type heme-binding CxxCH protein [Jiulongibacter sediminis]KPM47243.1 hypothetical protein AFM12_15710 [Jiulongibacter sediminis]TBX22801.1 hypothetical protein TK44_15720 [Jiulongibacter sediminis]
MIRFTAALLLFWSVLACRKNELPDGFELAGDLDLSLVASEPLIKDPVDMAFWKNGDALVLEMPGYPQEDAKSRLMLLKDNDMDGVFDQSSVYAEGLQLANSFMLYEEGVLVAAPPYLLQLYDTDHDEKADKIDTLMGGFATGNLQHNYNSLTLGLDGWIYAANGGNDGNPYWWGDSANALPLRNQDFRFNLKTHEMERLGESSGGFGLAMDAFGRFFETHNTQHISHLVFASRYLKDRPILTDHTLENISDHEENGLARIYPIGEQEERVNHPEQSGYFSGSCGITFYGGGAFGPEFDNTVWVADVVLNLLHADRLEPNGSSFQAKRVLEKQDVLASEDRAFRPVNMTVGPDGALYVLDMQRKVIEHPEWIPDEMEEAMDLNAGKTKGRIYKISRNKQSEPYDFSTPESLVKALGHPNQWVRMTAQRILLSEKTEKLPIDRLVELLSSERVFARLHALHVLSNSGNLSGEALMKAMIDPNPGLRENALQISEKYIDGNEELAGTVINLLTDQNQRVRMHAALSLGLPGVAAVLSDQLKENLIQKVFEASDLKNDAYTVSALALAVQSQSQTVFHKLCQTKDADSRLLATLALHNADDKEVAAYMLQSLSESEIADKAFIIDQLTQNIQKPVSSAAIVAIEKMEETDDLSLLTSLASLRNKLGLPTSAKFIAYSKDAASQILDTTLPDSLRIQYLKIMEFVPYKEKSDLLFACLQNSQPLKLQEAALRQLNGVKELEIGKNLVSLWPELSPQTRKYAGDLLLYNEIHHDALLSALEEKKINIGEMNFDLERRRTLLWWTDNLQTRRRAEKLFTDSGVTNRQEAIDQMKPALELEGNSVKGLTVFNNTCSSCHTYGKYGVEVGPILTEISRKSKATLLHDILDPNAAADPKYINHVAESTTGEVYSGVVSGETDISITLTQMGGEKVTLKKSNLKSFRSTGSSLMMEGLENSLSVQELADLLAFLQTGM